jgi:hypothetical protein
MSQYVSGKVSSVAKSNSFEVNNSEPRLLMYFLDDLPTDLSFLNVDPDRVVIAKVHLIGRTFYRLGRDTFEHKPPASEEAEVLGAKLRVIEVLRGSSDMPPNILVSFGVRAPTYTRIPAPITTDQLQRDYFVAIYSDSLGDWHLAGVPIPRWKYLEWEQEVEEFQGKKHSKKQ